MYDRNDLQRINATISIPDLLEKLGAERSTIKRIGKANYRLPCWWRGGDNTHGCGIDYDPKKKKWVATDFTHLSITNADLFDFIMHVEPKLNFTNAIKLAESCVTGTENDLGIDTLLAHSEGFTSQITMLEPHILDTFNTGLLHPYLHKRGYSPASAKNFDLGYADYGELIDRITIPIHDVDRNLVAVQGRTFDANEELRYMFIEGTGNNAKQVLYNYHRAIESAKKKGWLVVVEGAFSCVRLFDYGLKNVVATLSTSITDKQIGLLIDSGLHLLIWLDFDLEGNAGQYATIKLLRKLNELQYHNVSYISNSKATCPDDMAKDEVANALLNLRKFPFKEETKC